MSLCTVHEVLQNAKWKVRCLAMYYNLIFAGCSDCFLRIFAPYQRTKNQSSIQYQCIKSERLNGKQIQQIEIIEYVDLLIIVMDENVSFYSLYSPRELGNPLMDQSLIRFDINKLFECDEDGRGTVIVTCSKAWSDGLKKKLFIAFGKKREISVFQWKGAVASNIQSEQCKKQSQLLKKYNSYPIPDKPRLLILAGKTMFVGFKEQYDLIHLETSSKQRIFGTGRRNGPINGLRLINKEVLLVVDKKGYFVNYEAKPTRSKCIEFSDIPNAVTYFHPYIVSILPKSIEMHHLFTSNLIHKMDFKHGKCMQSSNYKNVSSLWCCHAAMASSNPCHVIALTRSLICNELKYLKEHKHYQEALESIKLYEDVQFEQEGLDKQMKRKYILEYFAYDLFNKSQWKLAVDKFIESGVSARRIISLFPTLVPAGQCKRARAKHPVNFQNVLETESTFKSALNEFLIPYLKQIKYNMKHNTEWTLSQECDANTEWTLSQLVDTVYCKSLILIETKTDETEDANPPALNELQSFLMNESTQCNVSECELLLKQKKKFYELVLLYESHNEHKAALDLMRVKNKQINGMNKTIEYLQRLGKEEGNDKLILHFSEWVFKEDPKEALRIFTSAPLHLDRLKVVDHLERIKTPIPTRIAYLEKCIFEGGECASIFHDDLIRFYLEEIFAAMNEQEKEDKISQDKYGLAQGDMVELTQPFSLGKYGWVKTGTKARVSKVTPTPNHSIQVYVTFPETGTHSVLPKAQLKKIKIKNQKQKFRASTQEGRLGELRRKLIKFLKTSQYFIPTNIKKLFPKTSLLEEQAWLRAQIPQHKEALNIIVYELEDHVMAQQYAHQIYNQFNDKINQIKQKLKHKMMDNELESKHFSKLMMTIHNSAKNELLNDPKWIEAEKIYVTLLEVYLSPPTPNPRNITHALQMLAQNHDRVDPIAVFNQLPKGIKVSRCSTYMEAVFTSCFEKKREFQIKKNLLKQASLKLSLRKSLREQAFQRINYDTKCSKCDKRIGQSAFVRYPDEMFYTGHTTVDQCRTKVRQVAPCLV
eukprot:174233_1